MGKNIIVTGSGFAALAASCYLAKQGNRVTIYEKNAAVGGRAGQLRKAGFTFDMGPTWYWMPDVFERFFADFDKEPSEYYRLQKLDPAYKVFFGVNDHITIPGTLEKIIRIFENEEAGSGKKLKKFIAKAEANYNIAIKDLVYRPGLSPLELVSPATVKKIRCFFSTIE
ncbi:MAG: NAD(P)-binding protein, partial [Sinomicrobium sp.]|nr:NAD(P)-binding protein [Sinomicrobium sp.]